MTRYLTANQAERYDALRDLDDEARAVLLADAHRVESYIARHELIEDDELRRYGERNDLPPDRLNAALAFLAEAGRVVTVG